MHKAFLFLQLFDTNQHIKKHEKGASRAASLNLRTIYESRLPAEALRPPQRVRIS